MYEHTSFTYDTIVAEQKRVDRANELRRVIAESPQRVEPRERRLPSRIRGLLGIGRADAAAQVTSSSSAPAEGSRVTREHTAQPVHAR